MCLELYGVGVCQQVVENCSINKGAGWLFACRLPAVANIPELIIKNATTKSEFLMRSVLCYIHVLSHVYPK